MAKTRRRAPGRPRAEPIRLRPAKTVPLSVQERAAAVRALVALLDAWLEDQLVDHPAKREAKT